PPPRHASVAEPRDEVRLAEAREAKPLGWRRWALAATTALAAGLSLAGPAAAQAWKPGQSHLLEDHHHHGGWDRQYRRDGEGMRGWMIPRNTDPTPVRPG